MACRSTCASKEGRYRQTQLASRRQMNEGAAIRGPSFLAATRHRQVERFYSGLCAQHWQAGRPVKGLGGGQQPDAGVSVAPECGQAIAPTINRDIVAPVIA
jgi:hypothetical protein